MISNHNLYNQAAPLPTGSWVQSSKNARVSAEPVLTADLQTTHGDWHQDSVIVKPGESYGNNDGKFFVEDRVDINHDSNLPPGGWKFSAKNYRLIGNVLYAQLQTNNHSWVPAQITVVPGESYENNNGRFVAESESTCCTSRNSLTCCFSSRRLPRGSWRKSAKNMKFHNATRKHVHVGLPDEYNPNAQTHVHVGLPDGHNHNAQAQFHENFAPQDSCEDDSDCCGTSCVARTDGHNHKAQAHFHEKFAPQDSSEDDSDCCGTSCVARTSLPLPGGSWQQSARRFKMKGKILYAELQDMNGNWRKAWVQAKPGRHYGNNNGHFVIEGDAARRTFGHVGLPDGHNHNAQVHLQENLAPQCSSEDDSDCCGTSCIKKTRLSKTKLPLPGGSWQQSAGKYKMKGNVLHAALKHMNGNWGYATIQVKPGQTFGNDNGKFVLEGHINTSHYGYNHNAQEFVGTLPGGSWQQSARAHQMKDNILYAELQEINGTWRKAWVEAKPGRTFGNNDGHFEIEEDAAADFELPDGHNHNAQAHFHENFGPADSSEDDSDCCGTSCVAKTSHPLPGGSWHQSARNFKMKGNVLHAELQDTNGNWGHARVHVKPGHMFGNDDGKFVLGGQIDAPQQEEHNSCTSSCFGVKNRAGLPGGSWKLSARDYGMTRESSTILHAELADESGNWQNATVQVKSGQTYGNYNGNFVVEERNHLDHRSVKPMSCFYKSSKCGTHSHNSQMDIYKNIEHQLEEISAAQFQELSPQAQNELNQRLHALQNIITPQNLPGIDGATLTKMQMRVSMLHSRLHLVANVPRLTSNHPSTTRRKISNFRCCSGRKTAHHPGGSWKLSSRRARMKGNILHAELRSLNGIWKKSCVTVEPGTNYGNTNGMFSIE